MLAIDANHTLPHSCIDMTEDRSILTRLAPAPDTTVRYGAEPEQLADVRTGSGDAQHRPLLIVIHGGFWRPKYDRTHTGPMCTAIASEGWTVASIEYRRIPGQPDHSVNDLALAIETLPTLITQHNGNIIVIGHSAGGHLALWCAARCAHERLRGVMALAPCADLQLAYDLKLDGDAVLAFLGTTPDQRTDLDPTKLTTPSTRVVVVHGELDAVVPLSVPMSYLAKHPSTRLVRLADTGHFALIDPLSGAWSSVIAELIALSQAS